MLYWLARWQQASRLGRGKQMRTVRWDAQAADGTWQSGVEKVDTTVSQDAINTIVDMLWARGFVGNYDVEVTG
jgi:hypothetical protein